MFLAATLFACGMYSSNQIFAQHENVNGTLNEAEINADIEQENKCAKDTECENENEINNSLNIVNITNGTQTQQSEIPTCEDCFTSILDQEQIDAFLTTFSSEVGQEISTLEELCQYIDNNQGTPELNEDLVAAAATSGVINEGEYNDLIACLREAGFDVQIFV